MNNACMKSTEAVREGRHGFSEVVRLIHELLTRRFFTSAHNQAPCFCFVFFPPIAVDTDAHPSV